LCARAEIAARHSTEMAARQASRAQMLALKEHTRGVVTRHGAELLPKLRTAHRSSAGRPALSVRFVFGNQLAERFRVLLRNLRDGFAGAVQIPPNADRCPIQERNVHDEFRVEILQAVVDET